MTETPLFTSVALDSEFPPSPPSEVSIQRSFQTGDYPPVPVHGPVSHHIAISMESADHQREGTSQNSAMPPVIYESAANMWQATLPTSYPMVMPSQQVNTPPATSYDDSSRPESASPRWSPATRRRSPRARVVRSPRERRSRPKKNAGSTRSNLGNIRIDAPMSQTTAHMLDIPLRDMEAWAHRSSEERIAQAEDRRSIARPMNAFMMYRSAYSDRAKILLGNKNYQIVNSAIAKSWQIELDEVKAYYNDISRIEPRPDPTTPPMSVVSGPLLDRGSPAWSDVDYTSPSPYHHHDRSQSFDLGVYHSRANTPVAYSSGYINPHWNSYPAATIPTIQPSVLHGGMGSQVEDVHYPRSSMPGDLQYDMSTGLAALPGSSHHELLQPQQGHHPLPGHTVDGGNLDPQMLVYSEGTMNNLPNAYPPVANTYPIWGDEDQNGHAYFSTAPGSGTASPAPYHQGMTATSYPMQQNPLWDASQQESKDLAEGWIEL
ncbi:hypothetical protein N7493_004179 [Penicillium malachiteum]|uniref:HMG box domain-containing protein n=1 Tax=Penicillium malachiteum TaxID=1324776 RepID=A0AAD6HS39_9EURO|nr:hypothetical protein N7493_004179 [Penicillium malachiteum]